MGATSLDLSQIKTDALLSASTFRSLIGLGTLATQSPTGTPSATNFLRGDFSWQTIDLSGYQPLDSDLTSIAALSTTSFGRSLLTQADASATRTTIGLGSSDTPTFLGTTLTGGTVTASAPLLNATQTWNNAGVTFTGLRLNITDTASNANSLLMDLQLGGSSRFSVTKDGWLTTGRFGTAAGLRFNSGVLQMSRSVDGSTMISINAEANNMSIGSYLLSGGGYCLTTSGSADSGFYSDAAQVVGLRSGTNPQTFRVYNTFTNSSNYERGKLEWASNVLRIGTEKAGTGSARALEFQTDGTTRLTIGATGSVGIGGVNSSLNLLSLAVPHVGASGDTTLAGAVTTATNSYRQFEWGMNVVGDPASNSRCAILYRLTPGTGGSDSSFGFFTNRYGASRGERLTIDKDGNIGISNTSPSTLLDVASKFKITSSGDIELTTTTGTKIGTATTQKLGFYNKTPVVQPASVADATDAASVITQLNLLLGRMRDLGLIAT